MSDIYEEVEELKEEVEEEVEMPEPLFRVETVLDVNSQAEASKAVRGKVTELITWAFMGICLILGGLLLWQYFTTEPRQDSQLMLIFVMGLALLFSLYNKLFAQKRALKRWEKDLVRNFGSPALHLTTEFFEHSLCQTLKESDNAQVEGYSALSGYKESENLLLLHCGQQWFFLSKNTFTKGNVEEFKSFISGKIGGKK